MFPFAVTEAPEPRWNLWDNERDANDGLLSESVMRKLPAKYTSGEWISWIILKSQMKSYLARLRHRRQGIYEKLFDETGIPYKCQYSINDPHEFKVFSTVRHHDGTKSEQWRPMKKSISNLYRYTEISKACNQRFMDALVDIVPIRSVQQEIASICSGKTVKGKHVLGFNE